MAIDPNAMADIKDFEIDPADPELQKGVYSPMPNGTYDLYIAEVPKIELSQNRNRKIGTKNVFKDNVDKYVLDNITVTETAAWRIAQWLLALGIEDRIATSKLCSPEFLASLVTMSFKADIGSREILGKKPDANGKLPIYIVNEITGFVSASNPPRPYAPGVITSTALGVQAYRVSLANGTAPVGGGVTEQPLESAAQKMAF